MEKFGHFDETTKEYVVTTPTCARPQENILYNDVYFSVIHQHGGGFSRVTDPRGYAVTIINGTEEPAHNTMSRIIYLRDDETGEYWSLGHYPVCKDMGDFECRMGAGSVTIRHRRAGIEGRWRIFVPAGRDPVEIWTLDIRDLSRRNRKLSLFSVAVLSLKGNFNSYGHESYLHTCFTEKVFGIGAVKHPMGLPMPWSGALMLTSREPDSMDGDLNTFMEQFRTLAHPVAVMRGTCSDSVASRDPIVGALHHRVQLRASAAWRLDIVVGAADVTGLEKCAAGYGRRYLNSTDGKQIDRAFAAMQQGVEATLSKIQVATGDARFDRLFNTWIPLSIGWGLTSGRWGMLGYRDIVQQAQGYLPYDLSKARARFEQVLRHQYANGSAVRSFPTVHEDSAMKYADSSVWLIRAVTEYVKESGDESFLMQPVPFLDDPKPEPVLTHLERGVERLFEDRGRHGLCRIHQGDWNDSLTHVGRKGIGESVWLTQALADACLIMMELHEHRKDAAAVKQDKERHAALDVVLNQVAWDGNWYLRAFDDENRPVGGKLAKEGRIFIEPQAWSLISRTIPQDRLTKMLAAIKTHLATPFGYSMLSPAFTRKVDTIGRITCLEPGCSENGSVYTHTNAFLATGLLMQGHADEAMDILKTIMPFNPENPSASVIAFQIANAYGGPTHRNDPGKAQFGWSTGSGAWLHFALIEYVFGLRRTYKGLVVNPCWPSTWNEATLVRIYRGCRYELKYRRSGTGTGLKSVSINNKLHDPAQPLPIMAKGKIKVEVVVGH